MSHLLPFKPFAIEIMHSYTPLHAQYDLDLEDVRVCESGISITITIWYNVMRM